MPRFSGNRILKAQFLGQQLQRLFVIVRGLVLQLWIILFIFDRETNRGHVMAQLVFFTGKRIQVEIESLFTSAHEFDTRTSINLSELGLNSKGRVSTLQAILDTPFAKTVAGHASRNRVINLFDAMVFKKLMIGSADFRPERKQDQSRCFAIDPVYRSDGIVAGGFSQAVGQTFSRSSRFRLVD